MGVRNGLAATWDECAIMFAGLKDVWGGNAKDV
jgi:hypothetical protein